MSKALKPGCIECANSVCDECDPKAGWIEWDGIGFPLIDSQTEVQVQLRDGSGHAPVPASELSWTYMDLPDDIVRYRVVNQVPGEIDPNRVSPHTKVIEVPIERALRVAAECNDQDDAEFLRSLARRMSYDCDKSESIQKHRLNEIAMRIATRTRVTSNDTKIIEAPIERALKTAESGGGKLKGKHYYRVEIAEPMAPDVAPYIAECADIIEALGMTFNEGEAFKAIWRLAAGRTLGLKKNNPQYDADKAAHYGARIAVCQKREKNDAV